MKSNFEERKENRLEAYQSLAEKNAALSTSLYDHARKMSDCIPFGQPILVGHHSEKRDRNYRNKIHNTMGKSVEASNKAAYYKDRAETLLNNTAISSDDPNAIDKLQEKLAGLEATQELYKSINKVIKKKLGEAEKVTLLVDLGLKEETAIKLLQPDFCGRIGVPSYKLTNNNGNMKRVRDRITHLERLSKIQSSEEEINGVRLVVSTEDNRVQLFFPGIPAESVRKELKSNGFRWAPSVGAWMAYLKQWNINRAKEILNKLPE